VDFAIRIIPIAVSLHARHRGTAAGKGVQNQPPAERFTRLPQRRRGNDRLYFAALQNP
jgi:hypothetical protein